MSYLGDAYTLTTSAVTLTSALGLSGRKTIRQADFIILTGAETAYLGPSTVDSAGADARAKFTSSIGYSIVDRPNSEVAVTTDDVYIVASATAVALITVLD